MDVSTMGNQAAWIIPVWDALTKKHNNHTLAMDVSTMGNQAAWIIPVWDALTKKHNTARKNLMIKNRKLLICFQEKLFAARGVYEMAIIEQQNKLTGGVRESYASLIEMKESEEATAIPPVATLSHEDLQSLYDHLHKLGFRFHDGQAEGELKACKEHIRTLQSIIGMQMDIIAGKMPTTVTNEQASQAMMTGAQP